MKLEEVAEIHPGGRLGLTKTDDYRPDGVQAFSASGQDGFVEVVESDEPAVILSSIGARCGRTFLAQGEWTTLANTQVIIPNEGVEPRFLHAYTDDERYWLRSGSAQPFIKSSTIKKAWLKLPPLPEQKKIAAILSSVDDAIAATRKVIQQTKRVKKGLLQDLVTRGIGHTRFKQTEIGEIPEEWEVVRLGEVSDVRRGASPRPISDPKWFADDGVGWIRISDVTSSDRFLRVTEDYLSEAGASKSVPVEPGDVIMCIAGTIGVPVIVDIDACIHDGFVAFHDLSKSVNPEFLRFFIDWKTNWLESLGQRGTQKNLNAGIVKSVEMPLPTRKEQDEIVEALLAAGEARRQGERTVEQLQTLKRGLMQDLLSGRVRVPVD